MQPSRPIYATLHPTYKIFFSSFNVDCEEVPLQLQMGLNDFQCSEDFKFLACYILNFYKNHIFPFRQFSNLITHTSKLCLTFTYHCDQLFTKMKHDRSTLHSQLSNHQLSDVLTLSTSSFNPDNTYFLALFSLPFPFKIMALNPTKLNFVAQTETVGHSWFIVTHIHKKTIHYKLFSELFE